MELIFHNLEQILNEIERSGCLPTVQGNCSNCSHQVNFSEGFTGAIPLLTLVSKEFLSLRPKVLKAAEIIGEKTWQEGIL